MKFWISFASIIILGGACAIGLHFGSKRFGISVDIQKWYACLPFKVMLTDKKVPSTIKRGTLVLFWNDGRSPDLSDRFPITKFVAALPGDKIVIEDGKLYINGQFWDVLHRLASMGKKKHELDKEYILGTDQYLVLGTTPSSIDSRYWGPINGSDIKGVSYVVF